MTLPGASPPAGATSRPGVGAPAELGRLSTEAVRPELDDLDLLGTADLVSLMAADSRRATEAVVAAAASISAAVDVICARLAAGGRLVYVGAGTAGRLAVLDAAELRPTFNVPAGMVEAVLAGGDRAVRYSVEGAEDDEAAGAAALEQLSVGEKDVVVGVSASGRTPFVLGAIAHARAAGAATIGLSCNAMSKLSRAAETAIEIEVGGEVIAGSSRLNAGTAQKITLNTLSTVAMVKLGKTYGNLMVDVRATNTKLRDRAVRIVQSVTGAGPQAAAAALEAARWDVKLACLMASSGQDLAAAGLALGAAGGRLRQALALVEVSTDHDAPAGDVDAPAAGRGHPDLAFHPHRGPKWKRLGVGAAFVEGVMVAGDVAIDDGVVVAVGLPGSGPAIAVPGLVDLQVNGYAGVDAAHGSLEELEAMGLALARHGVLAYQPTLITGDPDLVVAASGRIGVLARLHPGQGARVLGVHLEGPFLSPKRPGTHPLEWLRMPDGPLLRRLVGSGPVTMVTIAPELPGALDLVGELSRAGIVVSLGHSAATAEDAAHAVSAGASVVTHLFNGMTPVSSRSPRPPRPGPQRPAGTGPGHRRRGACGRRARPPRLCRRPRPVLDRDRRYELGRARADGQLMLGDVPITLSGGVARRPDGTIAGGASTLLSGLRHLCSLSVALPEALGAATQGPARVLGRADVGYLRPGGAANLVVLDDRLELRDVVVDGRSIGCY